MICVCVCVCQFAKYVKIHNEELYWVWGFELDWRAGASF